MLITRPHGKYGESMFDPDFYCGKTVFITGATGFKGAWMSLLLSLHGATVIGYALKPPTTPSLFDVLDLKNRIIFVEGDIRDLDKLAGTMAQYRPEIVIHMAAQPIVRESYINPVYTYGTNVMGTVNLLEAVRKCPGVRSVINVTTDKVYLNHEWEWGYRETDRLDGHDPYSNSKSCSELVTGAYQRSFLNDAGIAVSTCRAGNVIGGGDFAVDRIIPDCMRSMESGSDIVVRNPGSIRPYQHVLEPICAYLCVAQAQYEDPALAGAYNIGPEYCDCVTTGELADLFCKLWGEGARWIGLTQEKAPHEAGFLKLDCARILRVLGWKPRWHIEDAVKMTVAWGKIYLQHGDLLAEMQRQIVSYLT